MVMRLGEQIECVFQQPRRIAREEIGLDRGAFDEPGVAEARLQPRAVTPLDDRDAAAPRLELQRGRDANNPRPEYADIRFAHERPLIAA